LEADSLALEHLCGYILAAAAAFVVMFLFFIWTYHTHRSPNLLIVSSRISEDPIH